MALQWAIPAGPRAYVWEDFETLHRYLHTRERIEESGTDHRWEFDRPKLFKQTKYMSKICDNLYEIAHVLDQFYKFLGPELKEVTGDAAGVDDLIERVKALTSGFKTIQHMSQRA